MTRPSADDAHAPLLGGEVAVLKQLRPEPDDIVKFLLDFDALFNLPDGVNYRRFFTPNVMRVVAWIRRGAPCPKCHEGKL